MLSFLFIKIPGLKPDPDHRKTLELDAKSMNKAICDSPSDFHLVSWKMECLILFLFENRFLNPFIRKTKIV
jgi:hypothetical protein